MSDAGLVHIVDDDESFRNAMSRLLTALGYRVAVYPSAADFLAANPVGDGACLLLDVDMADIDGIALQRELNARGGSLPIVFLTGHGDIPMAVRAIRSGAIDFLTKPVTRDALVEAIDRAIAAGRCARDHDAGVADLEHRYRALTKREREVFEGVVAGRLNKQIGQDIGVAERTVKAHRARVMKKLGAESLPELVRMADALANAGIGSEGEDR